MTAPLDTAAPFDPTYGHTVADLLGYGPPEHEPDDFDQQWIAVRAEADEVDPAPEIGSWTPLGEHGHQVATISVTGLDAVRSNGWLVRSPGALSRGLVIGHGYGGRTEPTTAIPDECLSIQMVSRGQASSPWPGVPSDAHQHVLHGIESFRSYVHVGATADVWAATTVLAELAPDVPIGYEGGSFGGGIGALAAAWEPRFDAVQLTVPSFGNHPVRLTLRCTATGEAVRNHHAEHPEVIEVLRYVDAATAATRITVPTLCIAAAADPGVPPPGQFAVANGLAGPTWLHIARAGHTTWPGQEEDLALSARCRAEFWLDPDAAVC